MTLISGFGDAFSAAYSVVDLPEPVGPVTRIMPYGLVYRLAEALVVVAEEAEVAQVAGWPSSCRGFA